VVVPPLDLIIVNEVDEKMTGRTVKKWQMSRMVRMVVAAAPAEAISPRQDCRQGCTFVFTSVPAGGKCFSYQAMERSRRST
jgi:hypothetical protein